MYRSSPPEVFLGKVVLKICRKFEKKITILPWCFIEIILGMGVLYWITLRHGCSPINLLHIFSTPFPKNTFGGLLLNVIIRKWLVEKLLWKCWSAALPKQCLPRRGVFLHISWKFLKRVLSRSPAKVCVCK